MIMTIEGKPFKFRKSIISISKFTLLVMYLSFSNSICASPLFNTNTHSLNYDCRQQQIKSGKFILSNRSFSVGVNSQLKKDSEISPPGVDGYFSFNTLLLGKIPLKSFSLRSTNHLQIRGPGLDTTPVPSLQIMNSDEKIFSFGVIADIQYTDHEKEGKRDYRSALKKGRKSCQHIQ